MLPRLSARRSKEGGSTVKKQNLVKKLTLRKETLSDLRQVIGGDIISYTPTTVPIDDTVYHGPRLSGGCSGGTSCQA
jgi:hypothetical protein